MTKKNTATKNQNTKPAAKSSKKTTTNKAGKVIGVTKEIEETNEATNVDSNNSIVSEVAETSNANGSATENKPIAQPAKSKSKKAVQKKVTTPVKSVAASDKKIKLAASCYHYYRGWLKDFMRSRGISSAKFQKAPESYNGHLVVLESEKAKGLKALEQWNKENPDTKEMFWDVRK